MDKIVCEDCISDHIVSKEIKDSGEPDSCSYCTVHKKCLSLDTIADWVDGPFREYYAQVGHDDQYWGFDQGDSAEYLIAEILGCADDAIATDIVEHLSDKESWDVHEGAIAMYEPTGLYRHRDISHKEPDRWDHFCESIKYNRRYINSEAFSAIDGFIELIHKLGGSMAPIYEIPENEISVFRSRNFYNFDEAHNTWSNPAGAMWAPPKDQSTSGRMNAKGIAVFYGALDRDTAVAETRPLIGNYNVSSEFSNSELITVLDITRLTHTFMINSIFDSEYEERLAWLNFFRTFDANISVPILPHEEEIEYVPTQAIIEYIDHHINEPKIDAIIYSSSQNIDTGKNIVFLNTTMDGINTDDDQIICSKLHIMINSTELNIIKSISYSKEDPTSLVFNT